MSYNDIPSDYRASHFKFELLKGKMNYSTGFSQDTTFTTGINKDKVDFGIFTNDENATWSVQGQVKPLDGNGKAQVSYTQPGLSISGGAKTSGQLFASAGMDIGRNDKLSMNGSVFGKNGWSAGAQYQHNNWNFFGNVEGDGSGNIGLKYNF